jgi:hypothetical protein
MPTYNFRDKSTGEIIEKFMSMAAREEFLKDNQNYESALTSAPVMIDSHRLSGVKTDSGFKEVLQKIHNSTPGSVLNKTTRQL